MPAIQPGEVTERALLGSPCTVCSLLTWDAMMAEPTGRDRTASDEAYRPMTASILVVDDEPDVRLLIRMILEREGYEVTEAHSGEKALSLAQELDPDVILLDIRMPGIDGWEVLERLKEAGRLVKTAVVMISAHSTPAVAEQALELGCRAFITKPFRAQDVTATIKDVLSA